jgi:hypothetical protein
MAKYWRSFVNKGRIASAWSRDCATARCVYGRGGAQFFAHSEAQVVGLQMQGYFPRLAA